MAQKIEHSKGTWEVGKEPFQAKVYRLLGAERQIIADCDIDALRETCGYKEQSKANACLIAAAPDLLEALIALTEWGCTYTSPRDPNSPHELLIAARKAIAQAKGG